MTKCYNCEKEEVSGFVKVTKGIFKDEVGIKVYMCKECISSIFKKIGIDNSAAGCCSFLR